MAIEAIGFRAIDEFECQTNHGTTAAVQCFLALENPQAETFTVFKDDHPCAMFGCAPISGIGIEPGMGVLWFLGNEGLFEIKKDFMRQISIWLDWLQRYTPVCINYVSVENTVALRWCKEVGFEIGEPEVTGQNGELFRRVTRSLHKE
jgi:hypothetical protein